MSKEKFILLKNYLKELSENDLGIAFSGGVDSSLLLYLCKNYNIAAYTFKSIFQTQDEINLTKEFCKKYNVNQEIIEFNPLENDSIVNNTPERCYQCKKIMFSIIRNKFPRKIIIDGTNFDDLQTFRPGLRALRELEIISPFAKYKITKKEIKEYAKQYNLPNADRPSTPCLATRFPYNTMLSNENLKIVEAGELILKKAGFNDIRLRLHNDIARIEIPQTEFKNFIENRNLISGLKNLGIKYLTLDLEGLRQGSMDLNPHKSKD